MEDEPRVQPVGASDPTPAPMPERTESIDFGPNARHEPNLRRLMGRATAYPGPIIAITRCWVSRDSGMHMFAARFLDFAVLTPDHLVLCSTGFFTRQPRRRVFREPLNRIVVLPRGPQPPRTLRIVGDFSHPLLFELRDDFYGLAFAHELLDRTHADPDRPESPPADPAP